MIQPGSWTLAVDFGTTNTVAAVGDANGVHTLTIDGKPIMPSAVLMANGRGNSRTWLVGEPAVNMARRRMEWFEPSPKRCIPDHTVFLGGQDVPVVEAVAAVLRVVVDEAALQHGAQPPAVFVVTHPANWAQPRIMVLLNAAKRATAHLRAWPDPLPLPEPEAAARRTLEITELPPQARIVVLDLGGGTVDVATVDRNGPQLSVVGRPAGVDDAGGEDFDMRLAEWMTAEVGAPELYRRLAISADPEQRERAVDIRTHARAVKEQLSRQPYVPAQLPKSPPDLAENTPVQVSRPQLEELIKGGPGHRPGLTEAVGLVTDALKQAPPGPPLAGVFLVGGSSRIPLLGTLLQQQTGRPPITRGDPSTAVADGAASYALAAVAARRGQPTPGARPNIRSRPSITSPRGPACWMPPPHVPHMPMPPRPGPQPGQPAQRSGPATALLLLLGALFLAFLLASCTAMVIANGSRPNAHDSRSTDTSRVVVPQPGGYDDSDSNNDGYSGSSGGGSVVSGSDGGISPNRFDPPPAQSPYSPGGVYG